MVFGAGKTDRWLPLLSVATDMGRAEAEVPGSQWDSDALPAIGGALARPSTESAAEAGGALVRNLLGMSAEEQKKIDQKDTQRREKQALIAAAKATESMRLKAQESAQEGQNVEAKARLSKKAELLEKMQKQKEALEESQVAAARSPDHKWADSGSNYGYVSPQHDVDHASGRHRFLQEAERDARDGGAQVHFGYVSPAYSPSGENATGSSRGTLGWHDAPDDDIGDVSTTHQHQQDEEDDYLAPLAHNRAGDINVDQAATKIAPALVFAKLGTIGGGMGGAAGSKLTRARPSFQMAATKVIKSAKTPGFIMLERLHKASSKNLKNQVQLLPRQCSLVDFFSLFFFPSLILKGERQKSSEQGGNSQQSARY